MSRNPKFETIQLFVVALIALVLDQWSKHLIVTHVLGCDERIIINNLLRCNATQNEHGAFGLFGNSPVLLIGMALIVLLIFWYSFRDAARRSTVVRVAFGMILGGAIGNIMDRLHYHYVVDFIDFYRIWPNIFNVADACITCGVILLILASIATRRHA